MADVYSHNHRVLDTLKRGDAVQFKRTGYSHWGLYEGNKQIIHMTAPRPDAESGSSHVSSGSSFCGLNIDKAVIKEDDFFHVAGDSKAYKNNSKDKDLPVTRSADEIIAVAYSLMGNINYNIFRQNCEHFVSFCRNGMPKSVQAENAKIAVVVLLVLAVLAVVLVLAKRTKNSNKKTSNMDHRVEYQDNRENHKSTPLLTHCLG